MSTRRQTTLLALRNFALIPHLIGHLANRPSYPREYTEGRLKLAIELARQSHLALTELYADFAESVAAQSDKVVERVVQAKAELALARAALSQAHSKNQEARARDLTGTSAADIYAAKHSPA